MHHLHLQNQNSRKEVGGGVVHSHHVSVGGAVLASWGTRGYGHASRAFNLEPFYANAQPCMKVRVTWFHTVQYQAALLAEHINVNWLRQRYKCHCLGLQCSLTPWNTCVSSENISPDPYYCHSRALAVTSWVKCTCSPAIHGCTPTALPERMNAFCHRC